MTPDERAKLHVAEMERCGFTIREDLEYELSVCIRAALRERDAEWFKAFYRSHYSTSDYECSGCAPFRALLEEAGK